MENTGGAIEEIRTSADESDPLVQNLLLKQQNDTLKQRTRELESERDDWKTHAQKSQEQAGLATRLLTDGREKSAQTSVEQGGKYWRNIAVFFVVVALAGTAFYYRDNVVSTLSGFSATVEADNPQS